MRTRRRHTRDAVERCKLHSLFHQCCRGPHSASLGCDDVSRAYNADHLHLAQVRCCKRTDTVVGADGLLYNVGFQKCPNMERQQGIWVFGIDADLINDSQYPVCARSRNAEPWRSVIERQTTMDDKALAGDRRAVSTFSTGIPFGRPKWRSARCRQQEPEHNR
jgi:hypothetical protein